MQSISQEETFQVWGQIEIRSIERMVEKIVLQILQFSRGQCSFKWRYDFFLKLGLFWQDSLSSWSRKLEKYLPVCSFFCKVINQQVPFSLQNTRSLYFLQMQSISLSLTLFDLLFCLWRLDIYCIVPKIATKIIFAHSFIGIQQMRHPIFLQDVSNTFF